MSRSAEKYLFQAPLAKDPQASWYSVPLMTPWKRLHLFLSNWCQKAAVFAMAAPIETMVAFVMLVLVTKVPSATSGQKLPAVTATQ